MKLIINVTKEELIQAAENLIYDQLDEDNFADLEAIANIIKNRLEIIIEDVIIEPKKHLKPEELDQVDKHVYLTDYAYRKMIDRDIPYPPK
jgi:CO dehydrogenase/acetyl-CoA synthase gamma subunit (corrinoid Fe-S protein)